MVWSSRLRMVSARFTLRVSCIRLFLNADELIQDMNDLRLNSSLALTDLRRNKASGSRSLREQRVQTWSLITSSRAASNNQIYVPGRNCAPVQVLGADS